MLRVALRCINLFDKRRDDGLSLRLVMPENDVSSSTRDQDLVGVWVSKIVGASDRADLEVFIKMKILQITSRYASSDTGAVCVIQYALVCK